MNEDYFTIEEINENQTLLLDRTTRKLVIRKKVKNGEKAVYEWLLEHPDPHLARILSCKEENDELVILEESIEGVNLEAYLKHHHPSTEEKKQLYLEILDGVDLLHHAKPPIIHRDIKASNIMVNKDGHAVIIDFDAAKTWKGRTRDTVLIGTEGSAAPEQYGFAESDERTDIYALGILAKEMFPEKREFVEKATAMDPENRFQNIKQMKKAFCAGRVPYSWMPFDPDSKASVLGFVVTMTLLIAITAVTDLRAYPVLIRWVDRILEFMILLSLYMLYHRWTPLFKGVAWLQDSRMIVRISGYVFMTIAVFFFWSLIGGILTR